MLEEAVEILRLLWRGGTQSFRGKHYAVDRARLYTLPEQPPPVVVAAKGERAVEVAGRIGDGLIAGSRCRTCPRIREGGRGGEATVRDGSRLLGGN